MYPKSVADLTEELRKVSFDDDERPHLYAMLEEARSLVTRLETLLAGASADEGPNPHPIVSWRKRRHMPQSELARAAGISPPALCRIEHSPGFRGRKETRARIAAVLDVPEDWLVAPDDFLG